ncbi:unnamed protein product [Brassica oleracea var. botrytis]
MSTHLYFLIYSSVLFLYPHLCQREDHLLLNGVKRHVTGLFDSCLRLASSRSLCLLISADT